MRNRLAALAVTSLVLAMACSSDEAPASSVTPAEAPSVVAATLQLPTGCEPFASWLWASEPVRPGEPAEVRFEANPCAIPTIEALPPSAQRVRVEFVPVAASGTTVGVDLDPSGSGAFVRAWSGFVTLPAEGYWRPSLDLAGHIESGGLVAVRTAEDVLAPPSAAPSVSRPSLHVAFLDADRRPLDTTFEADLSIGLGWLAAPRRAVFTQTIEGEPWVVAGDLATGGIEPLVELRGLAWIASSPDGRAVAVLDRSSAGPPRLHLVAAESPAAVEVDLGRHENPKMAWSPDGESLLVVGTSIALVSPDGTVRATTEAGPHTDAVVTWAPDSSYAVALLYGAPGFLRPLRIDASSGLVEDMLPVNAGVRSADGFSPLTISPDSQRIAIAWRAASTDALEIALFEAGATLPADLETAVARSFETAAPFGGLGAPTWTEDGRQLLVAAYGLAETQAEAALPTSTLWSLDAATGVASLLTSALEGFYTSIHLGAGGRLLVDRAGCVQCGGTGNDIDVIDGANGAVLRTIADARVLGDLGGGLALVGSGGAVAVADGGAPRVIDAASVWGFAGSRTAASPDRTLHAMLGGGVSAGDVASVRPDGTGFARSTPGLGAQPVAILDNGAVLAQTWNHDPSGVESWRVQRGSEVTTLVGWPSTGVPYVAAVTAVSGDELRVAYPTPGDDCGFGYRIVIASIEDADTHVSDRCVRLTDTPAPAWSPDGRLVAHGEESTLAVVEADSGSATEIDLAAAGVEVGTFETGDRLLALAWEADGDAVELVAGGALWRVPLDGSRATRTAEGPQPGGFLLEARIARSPDGADLAAVTAFGAFVLDRDGSWLRISRIGGFGRGTGLTWAPDGSAITYIGGDSTTGIDAGVIVAPLSGDAYRLVEPGVAAAPLAWLDDGRIVFAFVLPGE